MAESPMFLFNFKEIAESLVKRQGIHEGLWGIYVKFGFGATNLRDPDSDVWTPAAISSVLQIGIQRFDTPNSLTIDAAEVNPPTRTPGARRDKRSSKKS